MNRQFISYSTYSKLQTNQGSRVKAVQVATNGERGRVAIRNNNRVAVKNVSPENAVQTIKTLMRSPTENKNMGSKNSVIKKTTSKKTSPKKSASKKSVSKKSTPKKTTSKKTTSKKTSPKKSASKKTTSKKKVINNKSPWYKTIF